MKERIESLSPASYSMFYTLEARAQATLYYPDLGLYDEEALSISKRNIYKVNKEGFSRELITVITLRTQVFDKACRDFLIKNDQATVISLGCGLCSRSYRLGAEFPNVNWVNLDLSSVIELRNKLMEESPTIINRACDNVTDTRWFSEILKRNKAPVFIIMEGLSAYLNQGDLEDLIYNIADLCAVDNREDHLMMDYRHPEYHADLPLVHKLGDKKIKYKSGLRGVESLESIHDGISIYQEHGHHLYLSASHVMAAVDFQMNHEMQSPQGIAELRMTSSSK